MIVSIRLRSVFDAVASSRIRRLKSSRRPSDGGVELLKSVDPVDVAADGRGGLSLHREVGPLEIVPSAGGTKPMTNLVVAVGQKPDSEEPQLAEKAADLLVGQATGRSCAPEAPPACERAAHRIGRIGPLLHLSEDRGRDEVEDLLPADRSAEDVDEMSLRLSLDRERPGQCADAPTALVGDRLNVSVDAEEQVAYSLVVDGEEHAVDPGERLGGKLGVDVRAVGKRAPSTASTCAAPTASFTGPPGRST